LFRGRQRWQDALLFLRYLGRGGKEKTQIGCDCFLLEILKCCEGKLGKKDRFQLKE
jgi:hypothetical protein